MGLRKIVKILFLVLFPTTLINGELEYEGNNYGDTSGFYFVGEIV